MRRPALSAPTAMVLTGIAGLHAAWGVGSAWPATDRRQLADAVAGTEDMPPAGACFAVAGALLSAAALVAGAGNHNRLQRLGRKGVAAVLLLRGVTGVTGSTGLVVSWAPSANFQTLDRRYYGPLCLALGSAVALSA